MEFFADPANHEMVIDALWFISGACIYRFLSTIMLYSQVTNFANEINISVLKLVGNIVSDVAFLKTLKYKTMLEAEIPEDSIEVARTFDQRIYATWKENLIATFFSSYPKRFHYLIDFKDWDEALKKLDKMYKAEKKS